jgi:hypothetical protein
MTGNHAPQIVETNDHDILEAPAKGSKADKSIPFDKK